MSRKYLLPAAAFVLIAITWGCPPPPLVNRYYREAFLERRRLLQQVAAILPARGSLAPETEPGDLGGLNPPPAVNVDDCLKGNTGILSETRLTNPAYGFTLRDQSRELFPGVFLAPGLGSFWMAMRAVDPSGNIRQMDYLGSWRYLQVVRHTLTCPYLLVLRLIDFNPSTFETAEYEAFFIDLRGKSIETSFRFRVSRPDRIGFSYSGVTSMTRNRDLAVYSSFERECARAVQERMSRALHGRFACEQCSRKP